MKWNIKSKNGNLKNEEIVKILLSNRGLKTKREIDKYLNPTLEELKQEFFDKKEVKKAIERIKQAIKNKEKIIVYSDYDADGITGGAILWETLDQGKAKVFPYVPDRILEGYGLSKIGIDNILKEHPEIKLIITVDHGITAVASVAYAKEKGIEVIISDHHTKPPITPKAYATVHTTLLSGSGVAYVFSRKIRKALNLPEQKDHLALAAFGTIADLVPLNGANRVIAKFGLEILSQTQRPGIKALLEVAGLQNRQLTPYDLSYILAPRINATGRLTHALDALRLLCTKDEKRAKKLALHLNEVNQERQQMLASSVVHAKSLVSSDLENLLFIAHDSYHEGVIGLIAGKLTEAYYRPTIVVSKREKYSKASARSIVGFNIIEAIRKSSEILVDCGGHPMAAGFTVETGKIDQIKERMLQIAKREIKKEHLERVLKIDLVLKLSDISWELYQEIQKFAPFGMGNSEPVFVTYRTNITDGSLFGKNQEHLKLYLADGEKQIEAVGFGMGQWYEKLSPDKPIDLAYTIISNTWNGASKLQLRIRDIKI